MAFVSNISNNWDSFGFVLCKKAEATCFSFADEARKNVKTKTNGSNTSCIFHLSQIIVIERRVDRNFDLLVTDKNFFTKLCGKCINSNQFVLLLGDLTNNSLGLTYQDL